MINQLIWKLGDIVLSYCRSIPMKLFFFKLNLSVWLILSIFICSSSSPWLSIKPTRAYFFNKKIVSWDHLIANHFYARKKGRVRISHLGDGKFSLSCRLSDLRKPSSSFRKLRRINHFLPLASADDGVTVNGSSQARTNNDVEDMRYKLDQSLQDEDYNTGLVQLLHDAARVFELAMKEQGSLSKTSWFSTAWLGVDKNAWIKELSYQVDIVIKYLNTVLIS